MMAAAGLRLARSRDLLSLAIVESLHSWPETQRRIFVDIHYGGRSIQEVSDSLGLKPREVIRILGQCERKLFKDLKSFRDGEAPIVPEKSPRRLACAVNGCFH